MATTISKKRLDKTKKVLSDTLKERKGQHGDFSDNAVIAQVLKDLMRGEVNYEQLNKSLSIFRTGWNNLTAVQKEALDMDMHKNSRIFAGDPNHKDHWHDKAGYSTLVENRIA